MKEIGIGIIGAGYMGYTHARTYARIDSARIIGIADVDYPKATQLAKTYHCRAYKDYEHLLDLPEVDAVSVCTPDSLHKEPVLAATKRGKHIFLEKPLASNIQDAKVIVKAVKDSGVLFQIGFVERFNESYIVAHKALKEGSIGRLISIRSQRMNVRYASEYLAERKDDVISFFAIHDIDIFHWFSGRIARIKIEADTFTFPEYPLYNDAAFILVRFENGALGTIQAAWGLDNSLPFKAISRLELIGEKGIINVDTLNRSVEINSEKGLNYLIGWDRSKAFWEQLSHFVDKVIKGDMPKVGLKEGLDSLKIALLAQEYARNKD